MASNTPVTEPAAKADAPVVPAAATPVVKAPDAAVAATLAAKPAPVSSPTPAKVEAPVAKTDAKTAVDAVKDVVKPVAKAAASPVKTARKAIEAITAPAAKPVAKKKAVVKAAPKIVAQKTIQTIKPVAAKAKAVVTKEANIMEATIKNAAEKAKTMFTDANAKSTKVFEDMNDFSKGNIEAIVESGKIAAKGIEAMGQDAAEYSRKQFESATAALKSMSAVKSPTDFFKLQSDYARAAFDSLVAQTSRNTETMLKLAGEVAQPISNRVAVAVEKVKIAA